MGTGRRLHLANVTVLFVAALANAAPSGDLTVAVWNELMDRHAPEIKRVVDGVEALGDLVDQATDLKTTTEDYRKRGQTVWEEVRDRFKP